MIGSNRGDGKAEKFVQQVFQAIVSPELLSTYTWTGRGKGIDRKNSFKNYRNIQNLMFTVLNLIQKTYLMKDFLCDIKMKVLKYAYLHSKKTTEPIENVEEAGER